MLRGEIYRVAHPRNDPKRYRSFVVVSRQALLNSRYATVTCAPIYTNGTGLATQLSVGPEEGLKHTSWIHCDELNSIEKLKLTQYVGSLSPAKIAALNQALSLALELF